jgi:Suppressor of fused protein (SUFU)
MIWCSKIEEHYQQVWQTKPEVCVFSAGPIDQLPHGFAILKFPPHGSRTMWTYATRCMSVPNDQKSIELHMFSPWETEEVAELLIATAHFHRTSTMLDVGNSVNFGKPWIEKSVCSYGLVSLPYLDGPDLEILAIGSRVVSFYWIVPITKSEVKFKIEYGLDALEDKFELSGFDYVNPERKSVV